MNEGEYDTVTKTGATWDSGAPFGGFGSTAPMCEQYTFATTFWLRAPLTFSDSSCGTSYLSTSDWSYGDIDEPRGAADLDGRFL
jgi:hypothetical protein